MDVMRVVVMGLVLLGLSACSGDDGSDQLTMTGTQKCTVVANGTERPCSQK